MGGKARGRSGNRGAKSRSNDERGRGIRRALGVQGQKEAMESRETWGTWEVGRKGRAKRAEGRSDSRLSTVCQNSWFGKSVGRKNGVGKDGGDTGPGSGASGMGS